ncbi:hypothetical protein QTO34_001803 [Cnephaeus nilssonii]|uniref:Envelope protein n=1 Tax=Cnephaeus nilssonii TaxID=3371016 RepID=A0AA40HTQ4_CNENI|nr:hypothetical protein QTO34_001803 [Eptesicus nilssonii]
MDPWTCSTPALCQPRLGVQMLNPSRCRVKIHRHEMSPNVQQPQRSISSEFSRSKSAPRVPHYTWEATRTTDGTVLARTEGTGPPTLTFDLCQLFGETWNRPHLPVSRPKRWVSEGHTNHQASTSYGCGTRGAEQQLGETHLYICPRRPRIAFLKCGDHEDFYCGQWDCETYAQWWAPRMQDRDARFTWTQPGDCQVGGCNPLTIQPINYWARDWAGEKTWGLRLYVSGYDPGVLFTVQRKETPRPPKPIGPLAPLAPTTKTPTPGPASPTTGKPPKGDPPAPVLRPEADRVTSRFDIFSPLDTSLRLLNASSPNLTADCWLCSNPEPPYYVGIGAMAEIGADSGSVRNMSTDDRETDQLCPWGRGKHGITLGDISGEGLCVHSWKYDLKTSPYAGNCNQTIRVPEKPVEGTPWYLVAPEGAWWACTTGVTPCLGSLGLQVYYYSGEGGREHLLIEPRGVKRAPVLTPLLVGLGLSGSTAAGTAALVTGQQNCKELGQQIDQDLSTLEKSRGKLEESGGSLAEVVLQNRRGLDLLFLKQGGLCRALGETCCLYTSHSGVIRESLSQLRKRLADREEARKTAGNWSENLFSWSPWLTTLLTAIAGPLLLLLTGLTFGPCLIRYLGSYGACGIKSVTSFGTPTARCHGEAGNPETPAYLAPTETSLRSASRPGYRGDFSRSVLLTFIEHFVQVPESFT